MVCSLDKFSKLAEELDNLQENYKVSFVISAGNYETPPLLDYPRTSRQLTAGRITTPADSVLGITVGAVSHVDYKAKGPKEHHPSAFSRHGAGPNYVIKPDLVHYGGSCSTDLAHISGIRSVSGTGSAEDLGTSFATPLVSRTLAQIYHQVTPTPSPVLARALLTHHARDPRTSHRVPDGDENFFGFGLPTPPPYCLECTPHTSTLVFDDVLRPGYFLEWNDFPYPPSLKRDGKYFGEIWMTVAFAPARGARWGIFTIIYIMRSTNILYLNQRFRLLIFLTSRLTIRIMSRITSKYQLTLPKAVATQAGYRPGDEVECEAAGEVIRVSHKMTEVSAVSTTDRITLFDLATERQIHRQRSLSRPTSIQERGWTRDNLYE